FRVLRGRPRVAAAPTNVPIPAFFANIKEEIGTLTKAFGYALLLGLAMALHGWAKTMIPHVGGYWADTMLSDFDHFLFGQDPWHLFRAIGLGPAFAKVYVSWFPVTFGMMGL